MTAKQSESALRSRRKSSSGLFITIAIVFAIVLVGSLAGVFFTMQSINAVIESSDLTIACSVKGDDLIIHLYKSGRSDEIVSLELVMEGYTIPSNYAIAVVPRNEYPREIIYPNVFSGIYTEQQAVVLKAFFTDGTTHTVFMDTLQVI